ncbi:meiotic nuclear division protein 1 homolog isoform X1 [Eucalyptus grandis]|uniref:meiotic nuclear division protein 1 homolog isoform X1 n=1 Tax=Eucalyptus grandis TaxID=71139 RepID=UPI00192EFF80|nr:meiotic nuclear division protein 1 homolog isoform X1 [Eucalyptus grandis]
MDCWPDCAVDLHICYFSGRVQSKKRGLSSEEKREKMLQIFYESRDFFLKLESDVHSSKRQFMELADQCNALKKGREESRMQYQLPMRQPIDGQVGISDDLDYLEMSTPGN